MFYICKNVKTWGRSLWKLVTKIGKLFQASQKLNQEVKQGQTAVSFETLMLYLLATILEYKRWQFTIFSQNHNSYCNHCTNTRLVCTHLNAFFMLNPNMAMKIWISTFSEKKCLKIWLVVSTRHSRREG